MQATPGVLRLLGWSVAYVLAGYLGRATIIDGEALSLVWPAAGIAALWLCTGSRRTWGWDLLTLAATTFVVNVTTGAPTELALVFVATNVVQVVAFLWLMRRLLPDVRGFGGTRPICRLSDLGALIFASVVSSLLGAGLGHVGLRVTIDAGNLSTFAVWWGRNTAGILLLGTLGLLVLGSFAATTGGKSGWGALRKQLLPHAWRAVVELGSIIAATVLLLWVVFISAGERPFSFLLLFTTVVAGLRLQPVAVAAHGLVTGAVAVLFTINGYGPFASLDSVYTEALVAQAFVSMIVVTGLLLAFNRAERDEAQAQLERARQVTEDKAALLEAVLENVREGVVLVDETGAVLLRNSAGQRLLGSRSDSGTQVRPAEAYGLFHLDGRAVGENEMPYRRALAAEESPPEDYRLRTDESQDGRILEIGAVRLGRSSDDAPAQVLVSFRDVTADRQDRDHLAAFAGVVAHDLLNPVTVIKLWAESLRQAVDSGRLTAEESKDMLDRIRASAEHMGEFINDLLAYTVARDAQLTPADFDISTVAEDLAEVRRSGPGSPAISVQAGLWVHADPLLVRQILDNLIGNAAKYVAPGTRPQIHLSGRQEGGWVRIRLDDNGVGIPTDQRRAVFDNFHRAHTKTQPGSGIGLAICRRAVERHGGQISVRENPSGRGSRFEFTLPAPTGIHVGDDGGRAGTDRLESRSTAEG